MKKAGIALLLLAFVAAAEEPLRNDDVIKLVNAGLTQDTIETKIFNSATEFRTDIDAMIDLTKQGVPDRIIRAMIARQAEQPRVSERERVVEPAAKPKGDSMYFDVAIHRTKSQRCDTGELKLDANGAHGRGCRPIDFDVYWSEVSSVCYVYGTRGVVEFKTSKRNWRVSTPSPADARKIVDAVASLRPSLRRNAGCS